MKATIVALVILSACGGSQKGSTTPAAETPAAETPPDSAQVSGSGTLDKNVIRKIVRQRLSQVERCYVDGLHRNPNLEGTTHVTFEIGADGKVVDVRAAGLPDIDACVADVFRTMQFPEPMGGGKVVVTDYPFTFKPAGG